MRPGEKTTELLAYNGTFDTTLYSESALRCTYIVIIETNLSRHVEIF
jgi:hypothetical protein